MLRTTSENAQAVYNELKAQRDELRKQLEAAQLAMSNTYAGIEKLPLSQQEQVFARYTRQFINQSTLMDAQNTTVLKMQNLEARFPVIRRNADDENERLTSKVKQRKS